MLVILGVGMGFAMAPATDSIMGSLPPEKAGVGSAVNDTTREIGGALGVAILGSITASSYRGVDHGVAGLHGRGQAVRGRGRGDQGLRRRRGRSRLAAPRRISRRW